MTGLVLGWVVIGLWLLFWAVLVGMYVAYSHTPPAGG